jgi:hypothetical protein
MQDQVRVTFPASTRWVDNVSKWSLYVLNRLGVPRAALVASFLVCIASAGAATAAATPSATSRSGVDSGVVTLRTTNDAGLCAAAPTATTSAGIACPTFPLYYSAPEGRAHGLVVVFHGHGHNGEQYPAQLAEIAARDHVVAVAMNTDELASNKPSYRGPFDSVDEEARAAAAAIAWARDTYKTGNETYLLGVSMGGSGLAYFMDAATRPAAGDVDATWVQSFAPLPLAGLVDAEGISNLAETWAEATGFDKTSAAEIEGETAGTPATAPAAYRSRSLALLPTSQWLATGLRAVAVVHDVNDGLVPYNQTLEARAAVLAAGIPLRSYDVVFKDFCTQGNQTTLTSDFTTLLPGFPSQESEVALCLAGHANENDPTTPIMEAAVVALKALVDGQSTTSVSVVNPTRPAV